MSRISTVSVRFRVSVSLVRIRVMSSAGDRVGIRLPDTE